MVQASHLTHLRVVLGSDVLRLQLMPSARVVMTHCWRRSLRHRCYLIHHCIHLPGPLVGPGPLIGPGCHPVRSHLGRSRVRPHTAAGLRWCCLRARLTVRCCVLTLSHHHTFVGFPSALQVVGAHGLQHCQSLIDFLAPRVACWVVCKFMHLRL